MRSFNGIADLETAAGTHLGYSDWHRIHQDQINGFADSTLDHQWIHVDAEQAAAGPFGTTIAHGFLTLSLVPMLCAEVYRIDNLSMGVNYGANKLRFPSPVPVGSRIRAGVELLEVTQAGAGFQVVMRVTVEREGGDKPACVVDMVALLVP
jgi:acyl dehydratase